MFGRVQLDADDHSVPTAEVAFALLRSLKSGEAAIRNARTPNSLDFAALQFSNIGDVDDLNFSLKRLLARRVNVARWERSGSECHSVRSLDRTTGNPRLPASVDSPYWHFPPGFSSTIKLWMSVFPRFSTECVSAGFQ